MDLPAGEPRAVSATEPLMLFVQANMALSWPMASFTSNPQSAVCVLVATGEIGLGCP